MSWFNENNPFWLPVGTIRAAIVLGLTYALIFIMIKAAVLSQEIPQTVVGLFDKLLPAIVLLIERYITTRNGTPTEPSEPIAKT